MGYDFQIVVDCAQPHVLADWWAQTLGRVVEPVDADFIRKMMAEGYATQADVITHNGALVWADGAAIRHSPDSEAEQRRGILFQRVPEPRTAKNRLHLDIFVGAENVREATDALIARGATFQHDGQQGTQARRKRP